MEMLLYLLSNWCCMMAASVLLWFYYSPARVRREKQMHQYVGNHAQAAEGQDLMISRDLQIAMMIGAFARVYWSCSPPAVWSAEPTFIQYLSMFDVFVSPLVWAAVVVLVGLKQRKYLTAPQHFSWPVLCGVAFVMSMIGVYILPQLDAHETWPLADVMVVFNMVLEGFAMIPQMHLVAYSNDKAPTETSHFVGLLSLGRVFRLIFWASLLIPQILSGDAHGYYIWTFILPDILHTVIMGDYLYVWLKKVKRDAVDPMINQMHFNV